MTHYQELTIIQQSEMSVHFIWSKLYTQLHLGFVELQNKQNRMTAGVSFPEYQYDQKKGGSLGKKIRIFAQSKECLEKLDLSRCLSRLVDYVHFTGIKEVPENRITGYAHYRRKRIKGSPQKLAKRHAKRHGIGFEEAMLRYQDLQRETKLPYINLKSLSNQQPFRLLIEKHEHTEEMKEGFGAYGLSTLSTVPEF